MGNITVVQAWNECRKKSSGQNPQIVIVFYSNKLYAI